MSEIASPTFFFESELTQLMTPECEWGVWPGTDSLIASPATCSTRVRCAPEPQNRTSPPPEKKCVFKWAQTTTAAATTCSTTNASDSMCSSCDDYTYMQDFGCGSSIITGLGSLHSHHLPGVQCFVEL